MKMKFSTTLTLALTVLVTLPIRTEAQGLSDEGEKLCTCELECDVNGSKRYHTLSNNRLCGEFYFENGEPPTVEEYLTTRLKRICRDEHGGVPSVECSDGTSDDSDDELELLLNELILFELE